MRSWFAIRTSVAVILSILVATILGFEKPLFAGVLTLLASPSLNHPFRLGFQHLLMALWGCVVALVAGIIPGLATGIEAVLIVILSGLLPYLVGWMRSLLLAVVVAANVTGFETLLGWVHAAGETMAAAALGILLAATLQHLTRPIFDRQLRRERKKLEQALNQITMDIAADMVLKEHIPGAEMNERVNLLRHKIEAVVRSAREVSGDRVIRFLIRPTRRLHTQLKLFYNLLDQLDCLERIHRDIRRLDTESEERERGWKLMRILTHLQARAFRGSAMARESYLIRSREIRDHVDALPLPQSQAELSHRALMLDIFRDGMKLFRKCVDYAYLLEHVQARGAHVSASPMPPQRAVAGE